MTEAEFAHQRLGTAAFASLLGVPEAALPAECRALIEARDLGYTALTGRARDAALADVRAALASELPVSGPERLAAWERGWSDILERFQASGCDPQELLPHYFRRPQGLMRLGGEFVRPDVPEFEAHFVAVVQAWVARTFLRDAPCVYEFGCGPGHNLVAFARWLPGTRLVGLDWAVASQRLLAGVSEALALDIRGRRFDMFAPDETLVLEPGAAVVTIGSLEQLGTRFEPFLAYLLAARPAICVHLEPIHELYDRACQFDDLAARYAERRGYLRGYLPRLQALERAGALRLVHCKKLLGNLHHDGWGVIVWRPAAAGVKHAR